MDLSKCMGEAVPANTQSNQDELTRIVQTELWDKLRDALEDGGYFQELSKENILEGLKKEIADLKSKIFSMDCQLREARAKNGVYREMCLESGGRLEDVIKLVQKRLSILESAQSKCASGFDKCGVNLALEENSDAELWDKLRDAIEKGGYLKKFSKEDLLEALKKEKADLNAKTLCMDAKLGAALDQNDVYREICFESSEKLEHVISLVEKYQSNLESAQSECASSSDNCVVEVAVEGNRYAELTPVKDAETNVVRFGKEKRAFESVNSEISQLPPTMKLVNEISGCGRTGDGESLDTIGKPGTPFVSREVAENQMKRIKCAMFDPEVGHSEGLIPPSSESKSCDVKLDEVIDLD